MSETRAPDKEKIKADYLSGIKPKELSDKYDISINTLKSWIKRYGWTKDATKEGAFCKQKGAPLNNKNAVGHGAPEKNNNAVKHGLFERYLPQETLDIVNNMSLNPIDILWDQIQIAYAAIVRAQQIMFIKDRDDLTKELKREKQSRGDTSTSWEEEYELQFAWDKHSSFMQAQARQQTALNGMIKQYEELCKSGLATEEQKARIEKLKAETKKLEPDNQDEGIRYTGIPASMVAPAFIKVIHDIEQQLYNEYVFPGGRGSTKSSFVSLEVIDLIMKHEDTHAVVMRQVADTLRTSVYQQILWAISALGLDDEFHCTVSPLEITRKSTGQKIYFRGADDPGKIKSIKVPFGYIAILWLEELDQFTGEEAVRKIEQSVIRGGDKAFIFKSFNPPKSAQNWANKYIKIPKATRLVVHSTYQDVPKAWLGKPFIDEAEFLKDVNPTAYENEYMGVANGTGGNVFDNVVIREITDAEIAQFDRLYNGVDWGWYPDPFHFGRMHYDAARMKLYIFLEHRCNKQSNRQTADKLIELGMTSNDIITCDSAEEKSVGDYRSYGLLARGAEKGPGSVEYSMKWLQSLTEIIIDNKRCPFTADEFLNYEYDRDKDGNVISGYPDKNNHAIDMTRYATNPIWKRRGQ